MNRTIGNLHQLMPGAGPAAPFPQRDSDAFLELVTQVFARFVRVSPEAVEAEITAALHQVLDYFGADRCDLFLADRDRRRVTMVARAELDTVPPLPEVIDAGMVFPWLFERVVLQAEVVNLPVVAQAPPEAQVDRDHLLAFEIQAALLIPIQSGGGVDYVIGIGAREPMPVAPELQQPRLKLLGEIFVSALQGAELERAQREISRFDQMISEISARLSGVWSDQVDQQIQLALQQILVFADVDQVGFLQVYPEQRQAFLTYLAHADGFPPASTEIEYIALFPWAYERLVLLGRPVLFTDLSDLPPEAAVDCAAWNAMGIQSLFQVPFSIDGVVRYVFAMTTNTRQRTWPAYYQDRLRVLGNVFISALGRQATMGALRNAERFSQATLDAMHEYVCVVDDDERVVRYSANWPSLYADPTEARGQPLRTAYPALAGQDPADAEDFHAALQKVLAGQSEAFTMESACHHGSTRCWIHSRITRFQIDSRVYAAIAHEDITRRKLGEQELEAMRTEHWHADRVARTAVLIASLSHELSQPMTAILSNAQAGLRFLARNEADNEKIVAIFSDIVADNKRAAEVIESLRVILRRQKTERRPVDVGRVLHDVLNLLHGELVAQQVEVQVEAESSCLVQADSAQLQQVFLNLLINGIDAMRGRQHRLFRLSLWRETGGSVRISIRDSGPGIPAEDHDRMFESFWTTKAHGTGMGLPICRAIIESHDGRIWIDSLADEGATFFISLPGASSDLNATPRPMKSADTP